MVNIARGAYQLERIRFESLNPTFLIAIPRSYAETLWQWLADAAAEYGYAVME